MGKQFGSYIDLRELATAAVASPGAGLARLGAGSDELLYYSQGVSGPSRVILEALSHWNKPAVVVASTANISSISGLLTIDGVTLTAGQRVLLKDQTTSSQNGIYTDSAGAWPRANDCGTYLLNSVNSLSGAQVAVRNGAVNQGSVWQCQMGISQTVGTDPCVWLPVHFPNRAYTPAWTAGAATSVGTGGTIVGGYSLSGPICHFSIVITLGTSPSLGTAGTQYAFSLPVAATRDGIIHGTARNSTNPYLLVCDFSSGATTIAPKGLPTTAGGPATNMTSAFPAAWAAAAVFRFAGSYFWQ